MGSWKTDQSSGFLTNFRGKVTESYAGTDPRYNDGDTTLGMWDVEILEVLQDWDGEVLEETTLSFPLGKDWFTEDGIVVEHPRGKEDFHVSSIYGKLVATIGDEIKNFGANASRSDGEELDIDFSALLAVLEERGDPKDLSVWKGLTFEFAEVIFDYGTDRKTDKQMVSTRTMPVAFASEDAKPAKKAAAKRGAAKKSAAKKAASRTEATEEKAATPAASDKVAAARAKAAAKKAEAEAAAGDGESPFAFVDDAELRAQLEGVLAEATDFDAYIDALLGIGDVESDDELLERCMAEDGPWATKG